MASSFGEQPIPFPPRAAMSSAAPAYAPQRPVVPPGAPVPLDYAAPTVRKQKWWKVPIWPFLATGYSTFGRSFAYLGVPPLFIGELFLVGSMYKNRGNWVGRFANGALRGHLLPLSILLCVLWGRSEEHTSELQSPCNLVCRL